MLKQPVDAYTVLWRGLTGHQASAKTALQELTKSVPLEHKSMLLTYSTSCGRYFDSSQPAEPLLAAVCLVDEMDHLLGRDSKVLYHLFSWPMQKNSGLQFLGVANTTNLPEVKMDHCY